MAMHVRTITTSDKKHSMLVTQMARVSVFDTGVGIFDDRNRMIGWIETYTEEQSQRVFELLVEIINNPRRAKQPDWSFIVPEDGAAAMSQPTVASARATAPMPTRQSSGGSGEAAAKGNGTATA